MSRVLLDRNCPAGLKRALAHHTVRTTDDEGWSTLVNGDLLDAAEKAAFDVMVTGDKNLRNQQNLAHRRLALIVLSTPAWPVISAHLPAIISAVDRATPGSYQAVNMPRPALRRRQWTPPTP